LGTVPVYEIVARYGNNDFSREKILGVIREQAQQGVDYMTIHAGLLQKYVPLALKRKLGIVSRGGALLSAWMQENKKENPFYEAFDEILEICREYDVTLSLGDGLRPGCLADASDEAQFAELDTLGELVSRCRAAKVQSMVEGPGHVPLDQIKENMEREQKICGDAPFYILGPVVIDCAPGYDHFVAGMGGMLREYEREKYILVFTRKALDRCVRNKFQILDTIRSIRLGDNSIPVTISIGVGAIEGSFEDKERAAGDALDIALQKGGDQAAVNDGKSVTPYGGRVNTMAGSTTITSRVNSQHLCRLMKEAENVLIMGHRGPDYDAIGSCVGLARLAICARGGDTSKIRIVINRDHANFRTCYDLLAALPEYRSMFINGDTALMPFAITHS
jgi:hypothetical protein